MRLPRPPYSSPIDNSIEELKNFCIGTRHSTSFPAGFLDVKFVTIARELKNKNRLPPLTKNLSREEICLSNL